MKDMFLPVYCAKIAVLCIALGLPVLAQQVTGAGGSIAKEPPDFCRIDRHFEDTLFAIRLTDRRLQFFSANGTQISEWYEESLDTKRARQYWKVIGEADVEKLESHYPVAPARAGVPPRVAELDELVVHIGRGGGQRTVRVAHRPDGPPELSNAADRLEGLARSNARPILEASAAFFAESLDVPNFPAETTVAQALKNSGVVFVKLTTALLETNPRIHEAIRSPGWIVQATPQDVPNELRLPAYVEHKEQHFRLRQFEVVVGQRRK